MTGRPPKTTGDKMDEYVTEAQINLKKLEDTLLQAIRNPSSDPLDHIRSIGVALQYLQTIKRIHHQMDIIITRNNRLRRRKKSDSE